VHFYLALNYAIAGKLGSRHLHLPSGMNNQLGTKKFWILELMANLYRLYAKQHETIGYNDAIFSS
jgi:hypothetical protein